MISSVLFKINLVKIILRVISDSNNIHGIIIVIVMTVLTITIIIIIIIASIIIASAILIIKIL